MTTQHNNAIQTHYPNVLSELYHRYQIQRASRQFGQSLQHVLHWVKNLIMTSR